MVNKAIGTLLVVLTLLGALIGTAAATPLSQIPGPPDSPAVRDAAQRLAQSYRDSDALDESSGTTIYRIDDAHVLTNEYVDNYIDRVALYNELMLVYMEQIEDLPEEARGGLEEGFNDQAEITREERIDEMVTQLMLDAEASALGIKPDEAQARADMDEMLNYAQQSLDDPMADIDPNNQVASGTQDAMLWALNMSYEQFLEKYFMPPRRRASTWAQVEQAYLTRQGAEGAQGMERMELIADYMDQLRAKYLADQGGAADAADAGDALVVADAPVALDATDKLDAGDAPDAPAAEDALVAADAPVALDAAE